MDNSYHCYKIIFRQEYNFIETAKTLEQVLQRIKEFIFMLLGRQDNLLPLLLIDSKDKELFNNVVHITLADGVDKHILEELATRTHIYAKLRLKQHYAIPFTITPEPFPLYRIVGDYNSTYNNKSRDNITEITEPVTATTTNAIAFALHANQRQERASIASYLKKHDIARTSLFYACGEAIRHKLQSIHYHCTLLLIANSRLDVEKAMTAFKPTHFTYSLKSNNLRSFRDRRSNVDWSKSKLLRELFKKPKKPLIGSSHYPILSSTELVSLMLPDSITGIRVLIDGIRPYTTGRIL